MRPKPNFPECEKLNRRDLGDYLIILVNADREKLEKAENIVRGFLPLETQLELVKTMALDELNRQMIDRDRKNIGY